MLQNLSIHNVVLIVHLGIDFDAGFSVLTGETGAGKSILLDALGLALGARADTSLIHKDADQASIYATFHVPPAHPVHALLAQNDILSESDLILRRTLYRDGRSRGFVCDQPISITLLRQIGDLLVDIHGQFETQSLLNPATHRTWLDSYISYLAHTQNTRYPELRDFPDHLESVARLWQAWQDSRLKWEKASQRATHHESESAWIRTLIEAWDALSPEEDEAPNLQALRTRLLRRDQIIHAIQTLNNAFETTRQTLTPLYRTLERIAQEAKPLEEGLERVLAELTELEDSLIHLQDTYTQDEAYTLEWVDSRLFALKDLAKKLDCPLETLCEQRDALEKRLHDLDHHEENLAHLEQNIKLAQQAYREQADKLSHLRKTGARILDEAIHTELIPLKLGKATFVTQVDALGESHDTAYGRDSVCFLIATNPQTPLTPLHKAASGGEMARLMLALRLVMAHAEHPKTLIFDEVDTGLGGSTADSVGARLARLGQTHQVLSITHAPQVAAQANHHFMVQKTQEIPITTHIHTLKTQSARIEEIARMLAGAHITSEARAAAQKLLENDRQAIKPNNEASFYEATGS